MESDKPVVICGALVKKTLPKLAQGIIYLPKHLATNDVVSTIFKFLHFFEGLKSIHNGKTNTKAIFTTTGCNLDR